MIEIFRGDHATFTMTFTDAQGDPQDLTGYTIFFTVKPRVDDDVTDASAVIKKTIDNIPNPETGQTTLTLSSADTNIEPGSYVYDIQIRDQAGSIQTPSEFPQAFRVRGDVTRRTE